MTDFLPHLTGSVDSFALPSTKIYKSPTPRVTLSMALTDFAAMKFLGHFVHWWWVVTLQVCRMFWTFEGPSLALPPPARELREEASFFVGIALKVQDSLKCSSASPLPPSLRPSLPLWFSSVHCHFVVGSFWAWGEQMAFLLIHLRTLCWWYQRLKPLGGDGWGPCQKVRFHRAALWSVYFLTSYLFIFYVIAGV